MASRFSLARSVASAVGFVPKGVFGAFIPLMVIPVGLLVASLAAPRLDLDAWLNESTGAKVGLLLAIWFGGLVLIMMQYGALYRLALKRKGVGPLGLQFGHVELRLLGAMILAGLLIGLICLPASILVFSTMSPVMKEIGPFAISLTNLEDVPRIAAAKDGMPYLAAVAAMYVWLLYFWSRYRLYAAATVAENAMVVTSAWDLTKGHGLKMMLGTVLTNAPSWAWGVGSLFFQLDAGAVSRWTGLHIEPATLSTFVFLMLTMVLQPVLTAGFDASAYRELAGDRSAKLVVLADPEPTPEAA